MESEILSINLAILMSRFDSPPQSCVDSVIWTCEDIYMLVSITRQWQHDQNIFLKTTFKSLIVAKKKKSNKITFFVISENLPFFLNCGIAQGFALLGLWSLWQVGAGAYLHHQALPLFIRVTKQELSQLFVLVAPFGVISYGTNNMACSVVNWTNIQFCQIKYHGFTCKNILI